MKRVYEFVGVQAVGLDPCSNSYTPVQAVHKYMLPDADGLKESWQDFGLVYVNPPYSDVLTWMAKCEAEAASNTEILALVPSRTDTEWFQDFAFSANAICFWRGRLRFVGAPSTAPFPSVLLYWGKELEKFKEVFGRVGNVVILQHS